MPDDMQTVPVKRKKPERLLFRMDRYKLVPDSDYVVERLVDRGYMNGDKILAQLSKPVNPGAFRTAHRLGQLVAANVDDFRGLNAHEVLKRTQIEGCIACDIVPAYMDIMGQRIKINQRIPRTLSWDEMSGDEFQEFYRQFSDYIVQHYWPGLDAEAIEQMAAAMADAA